MWIDGNAPPDGAYLGSYPGEQALQRSLPDEEEEETDADVLMAREPAGAPI